jgi:hypothetical protein
MIKRLFPVLLSTFLLASAAKAGPEFRVASGLLMLFDGGKTTPIRYNTQTDLNFVEGGSVRVFSTVTPQGTADVEVLARSKVDFYFVGADVSLAPSGSIRATVENLRHPEIKVSWDGGTASASKILQTPEELLSYFAVSQPPVFSKSPISDDDLLKIFPSHSAAAAASPPPETNDAVEVDFPGDAASPANAVQKSQAKPAISPAPTATASPPPRSQPRRSKNEPDKALLATLPQSTLGRPAALRTPPQPSPSPSPEPLQETGPELPNPSPAPMQNSLLTSAKPNATPKVIAEASPAPSPEPMPELPAMASESPAPLPLPASSPAKPLVEGNTSPFEGRAAQAAATDKKQRGDKPEKEPDHILKSLMASAGPSATASPVNASKHKPALPSVNKSSTNAPILSKGAGQFAKGQIEPLSLTGSETPKAMPRMPVLRETNAGPQFLPIIEPQSPNPEASVQIKEQQPEEQRNDNGQARHPNVERPDIVLGSRQKPKEVRRALSVEQDRDAAPLEAEKPPDNFPGPVVLSRQTTTEQQPQPQSTPFVIASAIKKSVPPTKNR